jgi:periplasmic protein TonB
MKQEATLPKNWNDLVFENRNKEYGAYNIREAYSRHVVVAAGITVAILLFVFAYPFLAELFRSNDSATIKEVKSLTVNLDQPPPITPNQPPPPKLDIPPPVKTIIKYLPPKVVDKEVVEEEEMPTIEEIKQNETGSVDVIGTEDVVFEEPVEAVVGDGDEDKIFTIVEQQPEYAGGLEAMYKFIYKAYKYPSSARRMGVEGTVFVSFVVDKEGKISQVQTIKGISADCDKEAIRVIQLMPPWKPGKQNGRPVSVRFVLPIKLKLDV